MRMVARTAVPADPEPTRPRRRLV